MKEVSSLKIVTVKTDNKLSIRADYALTFIWK